MECVQRSTSSAALLSLAVAGTAILSAASIATSPAFAQMPAAPQSCGWLFRISGDQLNVAFPDQAARYWVAELPIPPGFHVEIAGEFPHARYISFITYDPATRAIDGIHDAQIAPDAGSTNPFVAGADRTATNRSYTVYVRIGTVEVNPDGTRTREPNTVYTARSDDDTKTSSPTQTATLIYRVYEADQGLDITGGVGLPEIAIVSDDGSQREVIPDCPDHSLPDTSALTQGLASAGPGPGNDNIPSTKLGGRNPPVWSRYTNAVNGVANAVLNNDRTDAVWPSVQQATNLLPSGGFYENIDNAYMTTFHTASFGDVLVFHGKAPTTPQTYSPDDTTMGSGQLRYWSMCSNMSTTQFLGCVKDDDVTLDADGFYTIVISTQANRPQTANSTCGIEWLPKGPLPSAPIILRNMLPDPSFTQAIQHATQGTEQSTLGPYYPQGYFFDHASNFDAFVNANGGCASFTWPGTPQQSYQPPGLPILDP
jgi:hypothetical protein